MKNILIYLSFVILLFIFAFLVSNQFIRLSLSFLTLDGTIIGASAMNSVFNERVFFSLTMASLPVIQLMLNKFNKNSTHVTKPVLLSIGLILILGIMSWQFRIVQLNSQIETISSMIPFNRLNFSLYLFIGFLIGGGLSLINAKLFGRLRK